MPRGSNMAFINQGHDYCKDLLGGSSSFEFADHLSSPGIYEPESAMIGPSSSSSSSSSLSSSTSTNSSGVLNHAYHYAMNYEHEEGGHSVINFKGGYVNDNNYSLVGADGSFLSFEQVHDYSILDHENNDDITTPRSTINNVRLLENFNSIQTATGSSCSMKEKHYGDEQEPFGWLNSQAITDQESRLTQELPNFHKRPRTKLQGESIQTLKKQCTSAAAAAARKPKPKSAISSTQYSSKDPQSIAAKNRREWINERLKILQDLVPNGSKVDLVTMLEKAISYVKFLQLQVKVLATDELCPVEGGKAPELSQVKDAIDAIVASQRGTNST